MFLEKTNSNSSPDEREKHFFVVALSAVESLDNKKIFGMKAGIIIIRN